MLLTNVVVVPNWCYLPAKSKQPSWSVEGSHIITFFLAIFPGGRLMSDWKIKSDFPFSTVSIGAVTYDNQLECG